MKNTVKRLAAFVFSVILLASSAVMASASGIAKADITLGMTVDVAHYNTASDSYELGTLSTSKAQYGYLILDETTFAHADGIVSDTAKNKMQLIKNDCELVMAEHSEINKTRYGHIDSESIKSNIAVICPYVTPMLVEQNAGCEDNIWMALGDKAGHIVDVYITLTDADIYVPVTEEPGVSTGGSGSGSAPVAPETVSVSVLTPKKMSIRLEDGTVLSNGDSFTIAVGQEMRFQMCSNNWDNNTYDDNGNGIAGTVVYTVKVSDSYAGRSYDADSKTFTLPKGDLVLRTDVNKCFMAYKYHFTLGDYNKQTGIAGVVNTPIESLSVNLPLGSTITSDAYKAMNLLTSANIFIETAEDTTLSYTDYYWEY